MRPGAMTGAMTGATTGASGGVRWPARLRLQAQRESAAGAGTDATRVFSTHEGPLRLLKTLHPEGAGIAHAVLVHPPGGLVGGDRLDIEINVATGAHLLVTTPGASRYYRSTAGEAVQAVQARVAAGARLEWLPQETLAYDGCQGRNEWCVRLAAGASLMAMEVLALGLGESQRPFASGRFVQQFEIELGGQAEGDEAGETVDGASLWRERGVIAAADHALLEGPCGLAGHRVLGTLLLAESTGIDARIAEAALDAARAEIALGPSLLAGATLLHQRLLLLRVLAHETEPAMRLLRRVRGLWRHLGWGLEANEPRIWAS